jgi:hypothetical protein
MNGAENSSFVNRMKSPENNAHVNLFFNANYRTPAIVLTFLWDVGF